MQPTIEDQIRLEEEMARTGADKYLRSVNAAFDAGRGCDTKAAQHLLKAIVLPVAEAVKEKLEDNKPGVRSKFKSLLKDMDPEVIAYMGLRCLLDNFVSRTTLVSLGKVVGTRLEDELKFSQFKEQFPDYFSAIIKDFKRKRTTNYRHKHRVLTYKANEFLSTWKSWSTEERINVGILLIDVILQATDLAEKRREKVPNKNKYRIILVPSPECEEWMRKYHEFSKFLRPYSSPLIVPPEDWTDEKTGGYYSPRLRDRFALIRRSAAEQDDLSAAISAVNIAHKTAWQVNKPVLELLKDVWRKSLDIGIPASEAPDYPACPIAPDADAKVLPEKERELFLEWKKEMSYAYTQNQARISRCFQVSRVIRLADDYSEYDKFWYSYQFDFRGRLYAVTPVFSPQGPDFAKATLQFHDGKRLGDRGAYWLKIHGANTYGVDKCSFDERVSWVQENSRLIQDFAENPFNHLDFWRSADSPWQFYAFALDYSGYLREGVDYVSHLPIGMDGSCNGLQNLSALLRDEVGGKATNLIPGNSPEDIYSEVAAECQRRVMVYGDEVSRKYLETVKEIPRKMAKRPVMTMPYGVTLTTVKEYVFESLIDEGYEYREAQEIALSLYSILWDSMNAVVVKAREAMNYLQDCAGEVSKTNLTVDWKSPIGFNVKQDNRRHKTKRIETHLLGRVQLNVNKPTAVQDTRKHRFGVGPNFVHSLDASHMLMSVAEAHKQGVTCFSLIHDDFGTHAADIDVLHSAIRTSFVAMYTDNNPLEDFRNNLEQYSEVELPEPPEYGNLNIDQVLDSDYFFS